MSCKVRLPDQAALAAPMIFRQVGPDAAGKSGPYAGQPGAPLESGPDYAAQVAQLQRQAEQKVREAHAAGVKEGETAGRNRAAAELQPLLDRLARSLEDLAGLRARLRRDAEGDMVKLSLAIARRILRRELAVDPDALHGLVLGALEKLQGQEIFRVKVHPSLVAPVQAALKKGLAPPTLQVIGDGAREAGAVVFETAIGNLDASVESQLQEIERGLADRLRRSA